MAKKAAIVGALDLQSKTDEVSQTSRAPKVVGIGAITRGKRRIVLSNFQTAKKSQIVKVEKSEASTNNDDSNGKEKALNIKVNASSRKRKASPVKRNSCNETVKKKPAKVPVPKIEAGGSKKTVGSQKGKKGKSVKKNAADSDTSKESNKKTGGKDVDENSENHTEKDVVMTSPRKKKVHMKSVKRKSEIDDDQSDDIDDTDDDFEEDNEAKDKVFGSYETLILLDDGVTKLCITCDCCSLTFPDLFKLKQHIRKKFKVKTKDIKLNRVFECLHEGCGKKFTNVTNCRKHLLTVHNTERKYTCEFCAFSFKTSSSLKSHLKSLHSKEGDFKYQCDVCSKRFRRKQGLDMHSSVHSDERNFVCSYDGCGKLFRLQSTLHKHELTVHLRDKPFECHICEERFTRGTYLKSHMYKHTGVKRYQCDVCYKSFTQNGNLMQHKRAIHGKTKRMYECPECLQTFNFKSNLTKHLTKHDKTTETQIYSVKGVNNIGICESMNRRKAMTAQPSRRSENKDKGIQVKSNPFRSVNKHIYLSFDRQEKFLIVNPGSKFAKHKGPVKVEAMSPSPDLDEDDKGQSSGSLSVNNEIVDLDVNSENYEVYVIKESSTTGSESGVSMNKEPATSGGDQAVDVSSNVGPQTNTADNSESSYPVGTSSVADVRNEALSSDETGDKDDNVIMNTKVSPQDGNICITYVTSPTDIISQPTGQDSIVTEITDSQSTHEIKQLILKANETSDGTPDETSIYIADSNTGVINALEAILGGSQDGQLLQENILDKPGSTNENIEESSTTFEHSNISGIQNLVSSIQLPSNIGQHVAGFVENE